VKRGDVIVVALPGDLGKPRPALIIQSDLYLHTTGVTVIPITSQIQNDSVYRVTVYPSADNSLRQTSQLMTDKITTVPRSKVGQIVGRLDG
jgi:mRNA interferase MazF